MNALHKRVLELSSLIQQNKTLEAMERFYADDVRMPNADRQENEQAPRIGKMACLEHERQLLAPVTAMTARLLNQAINERMGVVFSEWHMEATYLSGKRFSLTEVYSVLAGWIRL